MLPVRAGELGTLIEMGHIEMQSDIPKLTNEGHRAFAGIEGEEEK